MLNPIECNEIFSSFDLARKLVTYHKGSITNALNDVQLHKNLCTNLDQNRIEQLTETIEFLSSWLFIQNNES